MPSIKDLPVKPPARLIIDCNVSLFLVMDMELEYLLHLEIKTLSFSKNLSSHE